MINRRRLTVHDCAPKHASDFVDPLDEKRESVQLCRGRDRIVVAHTCWHMQTRNKTALPRRGTKFY